MVYILNVARNGSGNQGTEVFLHPASQPHPWAVIHTVFLLQCEKQ
jgi:hypothetical protein